MAVTISSLLAHARTARTEDVKKAPAMFADPEEVTEPRRYPGSLNRRGKDNATVMRYRSMLDVEDPPSLKPLPNDLHDSIEPWAPINTRRNKTRSDDWADILCFYTAASGMAAQAPPTRAPQPIPNGKAASPPMEIPHSVSSSDPKIAAQQASDMKNIVRRKLTGYVGFANLPNQWHRKSVRKGFNFNVMVVGMWSSFLKFSQLLTVSR